MVTIPHALAEQSGLRPGDKVCFELDAGRLIVSRVRRRNYSLVDLLAMQGSAPLLIDKGWNNMPSIGQEVVFRK